MERKKIILLFLLAGFIFFGRCKHDIILPEGFNPNDTIIPPVDTTGNPIDTIPNPVDTTGMVDTTGTPCDTGVVYFANDVQPILSSSCAVPGCHDALTAEKHIILEDYNSTMASGEIVAGTPLFSRLYLEMLIKSMPPSSSGITLTDAQIQVISDWIAQGAQDLTCNANYGRCDTTNVSFSASVAPIINNGCKGCHSGTTLQGNVSLENYTAIMTSVNDGRLLKSITHNLEVVPMPYNQPKLNDCTIARIRNWIHSGAPNN